MNTQPMWSSRPPEDTETVRRQQKELRRIRERARRMSMSDEQIKQRRKRGRECYLQRKIRTLVKKRESKNLPVLQPTMDHFVECTTAEQIKIKPDYSYQCQQNGNLDKQQTEQRHGALDQEMARGVRSVESNMRRKRNRLTNVKREIRNRHKDVHPLRIVHIKRQARKLGNAAVDRTHGNRNCFSKLGGDLADKNGSISLLEEHAQILIDISRMNGHSSADIVANSRRSMEIKLSGRANSKCAKVYDGDALDKDEDNEETATDGEETDSESEEVIAILTGLSTKEGNIEGAYQDDLSIS